MFLNGDGVICSALASVVLGNMVRANWAFDGAKWGTHVLSLATIMHSTPETLPIPVMIPPAGISSPG